MSDSAAEVDTNYSKLKTKPVSFTAAEDCSTLTCCCTTLYTNCCFYTYCHLLLQTELEV